MEYNENESQHETPTTRTGRPANTSVSRRSFLRTGMAVAGAGALLANGVPAFAQPASTGITQGDVAILRFLAAAEIIESDLWQQYNELAGIQDSEVPGGSGNAAYTEALAVLDGDMNQYIHDNTEDEFSHFKFINAYLVSQGAPPVNLDQFRTLPSSRATGAQQIGRLTNLMQLTVDTSWWTRYRNPMKNPDLGDMFAQAIPGLTMGQFPAIPRSDADLHPKDHLQAIANTAGFHFAFIEQGGTSLYGYVRTRCTSMGTDALKHTPLWGDLARPPSSHPAVPATGRNTPVVVQLMAEAARASWSADGNSGAVHQSLGKNGRLQPRCRTRASGNSVV